MPLSKAKNRERMKQKSAVQPKDDRVEMPLVSPEDRWAVVIVQPIPNCPDGRYRVKGVKRGV